jgi:hypothetical protein
MSSDLKSGDYFKAGEDIAEIMSLAVGPIETEFFKYYVQF